MAEFSLQGMFDWAVEWCNKPNVGYWMTAARRNMSTVDGITYFDCSSFVFFAVWLGGGYDIGQLGYPTDLEKYQTMQGADGYNAWVVHTMTPKLPKIGFTRYNPRMVAWQPGDILSFYNARTKEGHTEICYAQPRVTMGAHNANPPLENQVSINAFNIQADYYYDLWRYSGETPITPPDPPIPPDPDPGGDPGDSGDKRKMPLMFYMKPYWKI